MNDVDRNYRYRTDFNPFIHPSQIPKPKGIIGRSLATPGRRILILSSMILGCYAYCHYEGRKSMRDGTVIMKLMSPDPTIIETIKRDPY